MSFVESYINDNMDEVNSTFSDIKTDLSTLRPLLKNLKRLTLGSFQIDTKSGAVASTTLGAYNVPLAGLSVAIAPVQSGSGDPSPSNPRPITGFSEAKVTRTGFNLWDEEWEVGGYNGTTGAKRNANNCIRSKNFIPVPPSTDIYGYNKTLSSAAALGMACLYYDVNQQYLGTYEGINHTILTTPSKCHYITFEVASTYGTSYKHDICINLSKTTGTPKNGDYVPYEGTTYTISFGSAGTVYGGTLDVTTGVLTVTHKSIKVSDLTWSYGSSISAFRAFNSNFDGKSVSDGQTSAQAFCTAYKIANPSTSAQMAAATYGIAIGSSLSSYKILVNDPTYNGDAAAFKTAMGNTEIVYELATPLEYTLTPVQVKSLLGENNVWSNTGDTTAIFRCDPTLYFNQ